MPGTSLRMIASRICCATCFALAAAWPSQGAPANDDSTDSQRVVAIATERIDRGLRQVRVLRASQPVELPRFTELLVAKPVEREAALEKLAGRRVAVVNSLKVPGQWEVYANAVGGWETLAGNIFKIKKVVSSSSETPVEVHINGQTYRLQPGQVLLVLG